MKKHIALSAIFLSALSLLGSEQKIVKPYTPSFSAQHPWLTTALQATCLGTATGLVANALQNPTVGRSTVFSTAAGITVGTLGACAGYFSRKRRVRKEPLDALLVNPQEALSEFYAVGNACQDLMSQEKEESLQLYKGIVKQHETKCPLFLLGECTKEDFWPCLLSRYHQPKYRETYEKKVVEALQDKLQTSSDSPLYYASFGSGGLFQDLVVLTKALARKPDAHIDINVIDVKYTPYETARDLLQNKRLVDGSYEIEQDIERVRLHLIEKARKEWGAREETPDDEMKLGKTYVIDVLH